MSFILRQVILYISFVLVTHSGVFAQVSGQVFRDFNANGIKDPNEIGEPGITVRAFNSTGTEVTGSPATTNTSGNYTISGGSGTLRVEFSLPTWFYASNGQVSNTSIQFISAGGTANLGINAPNDYYKNSNANPPLISTRQKNGDPLGGGTAASGGSLMSIPYNQGCGIATSGGGSATNPTILATPAQTGSIWGVCHQRASNTLFTSSFLRRHMGLGPGKDGNGQYASGAVYKTTLPSGTPSYFFSLDELGFPTQASGTYSSTPFVATNLVIGSNSQRGLTTSSTSPNTDAAAYHQVGRVSLGDIDLSEDEKTMFLMNLYDKKLYKVFVDNPPVAPDAADVSSYAVPSPTCTNGSHYPWAIKAWRGQVYVGVVCSAEDDASALDNGATAQATRAKLFAYVYKFDSTSNTFNSTPVLTIPLNYQKGCAYGDTCTTGPEDHWGNWADRNTTTREYSEPILADIEFDIDGDMIIGLMDRAGTKKGYRNADPDDGASPGTSESKYLSGDILRANYDYVTGTWTIEMNGSVGGVTTSGAGNNQGIGGGEFYVGDVKGDTSCNESTGSHMEVYMGGLALMAGKGEVAFTAMDPAQSHGSGILILNNTTGLTGVTRYQFETQSSGTVEYFGKAGGLGDLELIGDPAPIEIGNRVWLDTDNDGIQDAGEVGISGVQVQLIKGGTTLSTATTDANGNYYFSSATGADTASIKYGLTQLEPNMAYTVRFPTTTTVAGTTYNLTTATAGSNRLIDSNAPASGDVTILATDIPVSGANNHSFDVGYSAVACTINTPTVNVTCSDNGTGSNPADDTFTFTISATGTGTGANYKVDKTAPAPTATVFASVNYGTTSAASPSYPISGGNLTLTLTDNTTTTCTLTPVTVTAPAPCSTPPTGLPDLKLLKTASTTSVTVGQTLTYTVILTNEGAASATGVVIRDVLPAAVTYVSSSASQGSYSNATGLWTVGTVAAGETKTLTITVTVN